MLGWLRNTMVRQAPEGEEDSKHWFLVCETCGNKRSYWAVGGVRYKAAGTGKSMRTLCTSCGQKRRFHTKWFDETDPEDAGKPRGWLHHK